MNVVDLASRRPLHNPAADLVAMLERAREIDFVRGLDAGMLQASLRVHTELLRIALAATRVGVVEKDIAWRAGDVAGRLIVYATALCVAPYIAAHLIATLARTLRGK
jgi:hypothetical protein